MNFCESPCKDCKDRSSTCHGSCERYKEFTVELHHRKQYDAVYQSYVGNKRRSKAGKTALLKIKNRQRGK